MSMSMNYYQTHSMAYSMSMSYSYKYHSVDGQPQTYRGEKHRRIQKNSGGRRRKRLTLTKSGQERIVSFSDMISVSKIYNLVIISMTGKIGQRFSGSIILARRLNTLVDTQH